MVVKVKRQSLNSSGIWEIEERAATKNTENKQRDASPEPESEVESPTRKNDISPANRKRKANMQIDNGSSPRKQNRQLKERERPVAQVHGNEAENESTEENQHEENTFHSWTSGDLLNLVVKMEANCQDTSEEYSTVIENIDWSKVSFGEHSPEDCKKMWFLLFSKARTNRELVDEIREYLLGKELKTVPSAKQQEESESQNNQDSENRKIHNEDEEEEEEDDDDDDDDDDDEDDEDEDDEEDEDEEEEENEEGEGSEGEEEENE